MTNKTFKALLLSVVLVMALAVSSEAQTAVTRTTLSAAVSAGAANNQVVVASATGISASTASTQNYILVDRELMLVAAVNSTTLTVRRAQAGTNAAAHKSGNNVFYGQGGGTFNVNTGNTSGVFLGGNQQSPSGACTRTNQQYLPVIGIMTGYNNGFAYDCLGGQWVQGTLPDQPAAPPLILACNVPIGSVAYGSMGTSATTANNVLYTASIYLPQTVFATGISNLNGAAVDAASKKVVILYDSSGNLIANSATAGTLAVGNDAFQQIPFTATKVLVGPARYFVALQDDTADVNGVRMVAASTFNNVITTNPASTFGTVAATITAPTTFTADVGPIACIY